MAVTGETQEQRCDVGDHVFTGEVFESRTRNWLIPGDMVCVMHACAEHAEVLAAHPRRWWEEWLRGEGGEWGFTTLS